MLIRLKGRLKLLRIPNPGSDIDNFIRIYVAIYDALKSQQSFSLDDISAALTERNFASSSGFVGQKALLQSTRPDRSRDPLYNQSKMYSELFKLLGWIHPLSQSQLNFRFTFLGAHVVMAIKDPASIFKESALGIAYPNRVLHVKGDFKIRPFAAIIRAIGALDGLLTRDELIIGPMCLENDRDEDQFYEMVDQIRILRGNWSHLDSRIKEIANKRGIKRNTMENYTRFPLAVLKWSGWTEDETIKSIYSKALKFKKITEKGNKVLEFLEKCKDIRNIDLEKIQRETKDSIVRVSFYQMLERAGFDTTPAASILAEDNTIITSYTGSENLPILFSPFQEMTSEYLMTIFPNPSGSDINQTSEQLIELTTHIEKQEFLYSKVELNNISNHEFQIAESTNPKNDFQNEFINTSIQDLFQKSFSKSDNLESTIETIVLKYSNANQDKFYPLVVKLFRAIGYDCRLTRTGVNSERWDALIYDNNHSIPIEIKSPGEESFLSVKAIRQALENKVVLLSRSTYPTKLGDTSLVVCYNLPNKRSEVNLLINDVFNAYKIIVGVIDFRSLLYLTLSQVYLKKEHRKDQLEKLHGIIELSNT